MPLTFTFETSPQTASTDKATLAADSCAAAGTWTNRNVFGRDNCTMEQWHAMSFYQARWGAFTPGWVLVRGDVYWFADHAAHYVYRITVPTASLRAATRATDSEPAYPFCNRSGERYRWCLTLKNTYAPVPVEFRDVLDVGLYVQGHVHGNRTSWLYCTIAGDAFDLANWTTRLDAGQYNRWGAASSSHWFMEGGRPDNMEVLIDR